MFFESSILLRFGPVQIWNGKKTCIPPINIQHVDIDTIIQSIIDYLSAVLDRHRSQYESIQRNFVNENIQPNNS